MARALLTSQHAKEKEKVERVQLEFVILRVQSLVAFCLALSKNIVERTLPVTYRIVQTPGRGVFTKARPL